MTTMQRAAQDYLALRRSLGYRMEAPGRLISDFARSLDGCGFAGYLHAFDDRHQVPRPTC
jgi:hypothetical protein